MQIAGIQKLTLVDFPGRVAATVFTRGCSFRCPFCHNPELVVPEKFNPLLSEKQILDFLESRYGKLDGICITGGEPCIQPDIDKFISYLKALGYDVKLDTNGSFPEKLEKIIKDGDVDYIAMDIKAPLSKYGQVAGLSVISSHSEPTVGWIEEGEKSHDKLVKNIQKSIKLIMDSGIDYEFRTTVCHPLHELKDFKEIGEMFRSLSSPPSGGGVRGGGKEPVKRYFIQNYQHSKQINEKFALKPFTDEELEEAKRVMAEYVGEVGVR